ncbi:uncharacterized protein GGS22DRAFT_196761 [Annulohypoxylon maeteangense]|uniref:uncharacterized protein n=1 Tax=Annulohypoxylon maeteangense TaxID=1927788 RepID=UPI002008EA03|nr:uncharacterized protein GGS22DRAFT_196761 [Annulohypoxylon maeteangense]KAI0889074.1 hypothetical protein GGS22DRAFT_196761 [Annulohypoxylon maeteangense]
MAPPMVFRYPLYCMAHYRLTCLECLHSMNSVKGGVIPDPEPGSRIPCPEEAHSVEPVFGRFGPTAEIRGFHQGLSPEDRKKHMADPAAPLDNKGSTIHYSSCLRCGLDYYSPGDHTTLSHPSHTGSNGQRYILVTVEPLDYSRSRDRIQCTADFIFSSKSSKLNIAYECAAKVDSGSAGWNVDNAEIAVLVQFLHHVENEIIPYRKRLVEEILYTNSEYFAGQVSRFNLIVTARMDKELLDFLLQAHRLTYSFSRKAFVERNSLGLVTKIYPATEERRFQIVSFLRMVQRLASLGIRVYWEHFRPTEASIAAKKLFLHGPQQRDNFQATGGMPAPNNAQGVVEEDDFQNLLDCGTFDSLPSHEGYEAVERESPQLHSSSTFGNIYQED